MKTIIKTIDKIESTVSATGLVIGMLLIFYNVIMRYFLKKPQAWVDEASVIVLAWSIIIGFSIDLGAKAHICMDVIYDAIKNEKARWALDLFSYGVGLLYSLFITYYGYQAIALQHKTGRVYTITAFPRWIAFLIISITGGIMTLRYILFVADHLIGKKGE